MKSEQVIIETPRLLLRGLILSDDKSMFELDSDIDVHKYLGNNPIKSIEESRKIISEIQQQYEVNGIGRWAMIEKSTNQFIGWTGLKLITEPINNHVNYYDLGYRLIKKNWGRGFGTEAAKASLDYGFNTLGIETIYAMSDIQNLRSLHILQKVGLLPIEKFWHNGVQNEWLKVERNKIQY